jgi:hypothetical protein
MSGLKFIFKTLSLLRTIIMLFIRSAPNCGFVRRNHQRRTRFKRLFRLCSLVLQHQYQAQNYQHYANLTRDLLQAEMHYELTIKNHQKLLQNHLGLGFVARINLSDSQQSENTINTIKYNTIY